MKKILLIILIALLSASAGYGATGDAASVNGVAVAGISTISGATGSGIATICGKNYTDGDATCASGTADASNTEAAASGYGITATAMVGQSFQVGTNGMKLYSITIQTYALATLTNKTITIRYGTNLNLGGTCGAGNNCLKEVTTSAISWSASETKNVEVVFQDTNTLSTGTTYYFMVHSSATENLLGMYDSTGVYASGVAYGTSGDASDWNLTGHNDDSYDLYFVIKKCD